MKTRFRFERLEVWQEARAFAGSVYRLTRQWPREEMFALTIQVRRAAGSVAANIAEGAGRNSDADSGRFLEQAYGSLMEPVSHLYLALDEGYLEEQALDGCLAAADRRPQPISNRHHTKTPFARKRVSMPSTLDARLSTSNIP